jgi:hypothetical protein
VVSPAFDIFLDSAQSIDLARSKLAARLLWGGAVAQSRGLGRRAWPAGNYVSIFVEGTLDIGAQAAQCCGSPAGWLAQSRTVSCVEV